MTQTASTGESEAPTADPFLLMKSEAIGGIRYGMDQVEVQHRLGVPRKRTQRTEEGATGDWVETWSFDRALVLQMRSDTRDGPLTVRAVRAGRTSPLATERGVTVGSLRSLVLERYAKEIDSVSTTPKTIFVGDLAGGLAFSIRDGVVIEMFLGASIE